jgi:Zn-dependent protease
LFNLLPVGPLDGAKVFKWSPVVWLIFFLPTALVFLSMRMF